MTHLFLKKDVWGQPYVERCPTCAALLLNKEDAELHQKWHESLTSGEGHKLGNWDTV